MNKFRLSRLLCMVLLVTVLVGSHATKVSAGGALIVTMTNEGSDANPGDGICAVSGGGCSLRAAIQEANAFAGADTIAFSLPGGGMHVISITTAALPAITEQLTLDGTSQPNCTVPCIVLSGAALPAGVKSGLRIWSNNSIIKGFIITSWKTNGAGNSYGISITGNNNIIQSNDIGFWPGNPTALGNSNGISLFGTGNLIGGTTPGARNVISGNDGVGIDVCNATVGATPTSGNKIQGNYIGTNAAGNAALGNGYFGIAVFIGASNTLIGGSTSGMRNVISGNHTGIYYTGSTTTIQNNFIGTNAAGTAGLGNRNGGIYSDTGYGVITANRIAYNTGKGVTVYGNSTRATIRRNSIFSNTSLGIDLGNNGVTLNDVLDPDTGPNGLQNFPNIRSATSATRVITGQLRSKVSQTYSLDFYYTPASIGCDPSHYGEGKTYIGFANVTTNLSGIANFTVTVTGAFPVGSIITATATDSARNTSEFSLCRTAN